MMAQMLSRPAIRPAPGLRSPKLLFPLRDAAPMTERRRIVAAKATAASTAPVYLTGAGGAPRTLKLQSRSNDALSDWISRTAKPPLRSDLTLSPFVFRKGSAPRPSKSFLPSRVMDLTFRDLPWAPAICTLMPRYLPGFTSAGRLTEEKIPG